jgi:rod shape determining protein RodA
MARFSGFNRSEAGLLDKLLRLDLIPVTLLAILATIGVMMLYSAAGGSMDPWAERQLVRFAIAVVALVAVAVVDLKLWLRYAYIVYGVALAGLILVELIGSAGGGAQRWLDLGLIRLQPSEFMKIALVIALARYFHYLDHDRIGRVHALIPPLLLVAVPAALILKQPDLGTSVLIIALGGAVFWLAGVRWWKFAALGGIGLAAVPVIWTQLEAYQQRRIVTFLNPDSDPLGAGYHITQSKIALGSGGTTGKGFLEGTQSHLNFLPEKQTDFIFTMFAEEFGLVGGIGLMALFALLNAYGIYVSLRCRNQFGRLLAMGLTTSFFFYVFVNIGMVTGLLPVVGVPLPLISYGGTAQLAVMAGFGLIMSVHLHREQFVIHPEKGV